MPAVLRDLELLDMERKSMMEENDTRAPSLIWDEVRVCEDEDEDEEPSDDTMLHERISFL